jgi:predicted glutamine amidotransferase
MCSISLVLQKNVQALARELAPKAGTSAAAEGPLWRGAESIARRSQVTKHNDSDGWGVAVNRLGQVEAEKGSSPIYDDPRFFELTRDNQAELAKRIAGGSREPYSQEIHSRFGSVGAVSTVNNHPFTHEGWSLVHNGTIVNFPSFKDKVLAEIDPELRASIKGQTDSEHLLFLFLTRLKGITTDWRHADAAQASKAWAETVEIVARYSYEHTYEKGLWVPTSANVGLSNGSTAVVGRFNNPLHAAAGYSPDAAGLLLLDGAEVPGLAAASAPVERWWQPVDNGLILATDVDSPLKATRLGEHNWLRFGYATREVIKTLHETGHV